MSAPPGRRADPFLLPSQTGARFLLLIVSTLGTSLFAFNVIYLDLVPGASARYLRCAQEADRPVAGTGDPGSWAYGFAECVAPYERDKALWMGAGVAVLLLAALAAYWLMPVWRVRRGRLTRLTAEDAPDLVVELTELSWRAGLRRPPEFLVSTRPGGGGVAFGRAGRRRVQLDAGLVTTFVTDRAGFRAVVLHELAHLRGGDVDWTYLTIAVWWSFVAVALVPLGVVLFDEPATVAGVGWRLVVMTVLVYLTRNAVLRSREIYADVRAARWSGDGALRRLLTRAGALGSQVDRRPPGPGRRAWTALVAAHPDPGTRLAATNDPRPLFRAGFWESLAAGLAIAIAGEHVETYVWLLTGNLDALGTRWAAGLVFAPLAAGVTGIALWRAAVLSAGTGGTGGVPVREVWAAGLGLGAGLALGLPLSAGSAITGTFEVYRGGATAWVALAAAAAVATAWVAATARAWLPPARTRPLAPYYVPLLGAAACLTALCLALRSFLADMAPALPQLTDAAADDLAALREAGWTGPDWVWFLVNHPLTVHLSQRPLVVGGLLTLWLVPLGAALAGPWRAARPRPGPGTTLPGAGTGPGAGVGPPVRAAVAGGMVCGLVYGGLVVGLRVVVHREVAGVARSAAEFLLLFEYWQVGLAVGMQVVAAVGVAVYVAGWRREPSGVVLGMMAAFVAGVLAAGAELFLIGFGGCVDALSLKPGPCAWDFDGVFVRLEIGKIVGIGAVAALVAASAAVAVIWLSRWVFRLSAARLPPRRPASGAGRSRPEILVAAVLAAGVVAVLAGGAAGAGTAAPERPSSSAAQRAAAETCALQRRLVAGMDTLTPARLQELLLELLTAADESNDTELLTGVADMIRGLSRSDPELFAAGLRKIQERCRHIPS
ncbi:M48 family metalloprotease [Sphaerisporangium aureirubrum]|uniref:M48 family metalloprotease n=1 Tax=Sphaerisporangium aureirubrum TaxID=1544736 RepID=A0ABW1NGH9_9ACTN